MHNPEPGAPPPFRGPHQPPTQPQYQQSGAQGPEPSSRPSPGRGFVISGIVLLVVAALGTAIAVVFFGGRVDLDAFSRDVAVAGQAESDVPGQVGFRVIESLSSQEDSMTVGVAVSGDSTGVECEILSVEGESVVLRRGGSGDTIVSPDVDAAWDIVVVARDLAPGEYSAACTSGGEPSGSSEDRFTVGRVVTVAEVFDFAGPAFGVLVAVVLGGLLGVLGLVLVVVGSVIGRRARRRGPQPPQRGPPPPGTQGPANPPPGPPAGPSVPPPGPPSGPRQP